MEEKDLEREKENEMGGEALEEEGKGRPKKEKFKNNERIKEKE